jgi:4-amino-4-deoxy-L-arabinose transferase-like glycosyltransferase
VRINKYSILIFILIVVSFIVRIYHIKNLSLFGDEIDVGYQAFSLLNTGKDYKGNFLPTYIQSLSESRAPLLIYASIPGIKIFGLNELGVRITPIIFGILSIYLLYKVILLLSKYQPLALLSATALSFSPWHFHYSRTSFEVTLLLTLILLGTYFIFKYFNSSKNLSIYLSILFFSLSFYTYNTANIFVPLLVVFIFISNFSKFKSKLKPKTFIFSFLLFGFIISPLFYQIFFGSAANRFNLISVFKDQTIINNIVDKRTIFSASNPKIESIFHNKPIAWTQELTKNYLSAFSIPFLFNNGDVLNLRHSIPGFGLIFISFLPFLIIGLFSLDLKLKINQLMLFWLLISPVASSITTNGGNHATRLFLMLPSISYFIGLGVFKLLESKNLFKKIILIILIVTSIIEISLYSHEYFVHYPKDSFQVWNRGYQEIFQNIPLNSSRVFISNTKYNSLLPYLFYQTYSPQKFDVLKDSEEKNIIDDLSGFKLSSNIYFVNNWQSQNDTFKKVSSLAQKGDTFILFQLNEIPGDWNLSKTPLSEFNTIKTIFNPNQTILAQIIQKQ